jgi:hypothetical protein
MQISIKSFTTLRLSVKLYEEAELCRPEGLIWNVEHSNGWKVYTPIDLFEQQEPQNQDKLILNTVLEVMTLELAGLFGLTLSDLSRKRSH